MIPMKSRRIKIHNITDISNMVCEANKVFGDVILRHGKFAVDGTSLLGVMSIVNTEEPIIIEYPEEAKDFDEFLSNFTI